MLGIVAVLENYDDVGPRFYKNYLYNWLYTLKAFGGTHLLLIDHDVLGYLPGDSQITSKLYLRLTDILSEYSTAKFVFFETQDCVPMSHPITTLREYEHPPGDVFYVFGADHTKGINFSELQEDGYLDGNDIVTIETNNKGRYNVQAPLWSYTTAALALYDRSMKEQYGN